MPNLHIPEHLAKLKRGSQYWNKWRADNPEEAPLLSGTDLRGMKLQNYDLSNASLMYTNLEGANLRGANLTKSHLHRADLSEANLGMATLIGANLSNANLYDSCFVNANLEDSHLTSATLNLANFTGANLKNADLSAALMNVAKFDRADLTGASLFICHAAEASFEGATLIGCNVYGMSTWGIKLKGAIQRDLQIAKQDDVPITVDNLALAQFIHLMLNNKNMRDVIDTMTTKTVLILGRFTRHSVLDAIRTRLRKRNYVPVLFDFDRPKNRDLIETVELLARMSRYLVVDLSDPNSAPFELGAIYKDISTSTPIVGLFSETPGHDDVFPVYKSVLSKPNSLPVVKYKDEEHLMSIFDEEVIDPAEAKANELTKSFL